MARNTIIQVTCDQCGASIEEGPATAFALNGFAYELDLCSDHQTALEKAVQPFVKVAQQVKSATGRSMTSSRPSRGRTGLTARRDPEQLKPIRDWARANGFQVSDRGRIPHEVEQAYNARRQS